ncbi:MAG: dihydropteroate synthase [Pseudomonadota bacterium]
MLSQPQVMGILNVTPDSFSDGGQFVQAGGLIDPEAVYERALAMVNAGVSIIDVGGESTRPGADLVSVDEELARVIPVIERLRDLPVVLSVDTSTPEVIEQAIGLGVGLINDVRALSRVTDYRVLRESDVAICLMHMQGQPKTMQAAPHYSNVVHNVMTFFQSQIEQCERAGLCKKRLIIDPGFGFGKTLEHNLRLLHNLKELETLNLPILVGLSRKSMLKGVLGDLSDEQRVSASVVAAVLAVQNGASIVRVHDVEQTIHALKLFQSVEYAP